MNLVSARVHARASGAEPASSGTAEASETLTVQAYRRLRADILAGDLPPDQKLKVGLLRDKLGFGASPIREALSLLTSDGLVERLDKRGFRVAGISEEEFDDLHQTRCWIEERALRDSIAHGDQAWEEAVLLTHHRLARTQRASGGDRPYLPDPKWEALHKRFHMTLIAACPSRTLLRLCDQLYDRNIRYRNLAGSRSYPSRDFASEHAAIAEAVIARNADLAAERLISHYRRTGEFLRSTL